MTDETPPTEAKSWRCFHCDELFDDPKCAAEHFGAEYDFSEPVCVVARNTTLEVLVATNREMWTKMRNSQDTHEQVEFERDCWAEAARSLTGKVNPSWHDIGSAGRELVAKERDRRLASEAILKDLLIYLIQVAPTFLKAWWQEYDPQLISPTEYIEHLEKST